MSEERRIAVVVVLDTEEAFRDFLDLAEKKITREGDVEASAPR